MTASLPFSFKDPHWTSGAKKKGGFQISLATDL